MARRRRRRRSFGYSAPVHKTFATDAVKRARQFLSRARTAETCSEAIDALSKGTFWLGLYKADRRAATANTKKPLSTNIGSIAIRAKRRVVAKCAR